jgi:hypothetical protein
MKHCAFCNEFDVCSKCFNKIPLSLRHHERYLYPLIECKHDLEILMAAAETLAQRHEDQPVPPKHKKPKYDITQPPMPPKVAAAASCGGR